jgi:hypothetical protein
LELSSPIDEPVAAAALPRSGISGVSWCDGGDGRHRFGFDREGLQLIEEFPGRLGAVLVVFHERWIQAGLRMAGRGGGCVVHEDVPGDEQREGGDDKAGEEEHGSFVFLEMR